VTKNPLRIGIDVGGTNTDAVLMSGNDVLAAVKRLTTADVGSGVVDAVSALLAESDTRASSISSVMIGTTQFINAFVQRKGLARIAALRVSLPKTDGVPPLVGWPEDLLDVVGKETHLVGGGSYHDGKDYAPLDEAGIAAAARAIGGKGIRAIAITANFSPIRPDLEERAAAIVQRELPDARITLSAQVGGIGLVDRENAALINAALSEIGQRVVSSMQQAFRDLRVTAPIYISQNDGTLIATEYAARYPIFTCSAGPTNSLRGAAFLTGLKDAIVVDVGGTTTDLGFVNGFPRETALPHSIGGVRTNFRMPDVLSIALGGGSLVRVSSDAVTLGPDSVAFELSTRARIFGGRELTTTDIAVRTGQLQLGDASKVRDIDAATAARVVDAIHARVEDAIDQIKVNAAPVPVILVGGGSVLLSRPLQGSSETLRPAHAGVANAVGAAIALVSGRVDKSYDFKRLGREAALDQARNEAIEAAVAAGADRSTVEVVDIVELPSTYMQTGGTKVKVRAVGELATRQVG
jgi:N-methylhydantoinase A/oxoprolinase/acetone carboxylase beta subunit